MNLKQLIFSLLFALTCAIYNANASEDNNVNMAADVELAIMKPTFANLPESTPSEDLDPDEYRCLALMTTQCCVPKSAVNAIEAKHTRSFLRRYADLIAYTACIGFGSLFSLPYYLVGNDCSSPSNFTNFAEFANQYDDYQSCLDSSATTSSILSGVGLGAVTIAAIAGQQLYSVFSKRYEAVNNSYQDALHRLETIYLAMSKVFLNEYIDNILTIKDQIPSNLDWTQIDPLTIEERANLDQQLDEPTLTFDQIKKALTKTSSIKSDLTALGVSDLESDELVRPLTQLNKLLNENSNAKESFLKLLLIDSARNDNRVFARKKKLFKNIVRVIHDEDLKSIIRSKAHY